MRKKELYYIGKHKINLKAFIFKSEIVINTIGFQGSPSVSITPCYDGRTLAGVQKVVKDGLSVISIKQSHRNCQFSTDPITKLPQLSCAQGIKVIQTTVIRRGKGRARAL